MKYWGGSTASGQRLKAGRVEVAERTVDKVHERTVARGAERRRAPLVPSSPNGEQARGNITERQMQRTPDGLPARQIAC
jgi:hypothetical protein